MTIRCKVFALYVLHGESPVHILGKELRFRTEKILIINFVPVLDNLVQNKDDRVQCARS